MDSSYLCLGGIELVNHCRMLAYLRTMGNPAMATPPSTSGCCDCTPTPPVDPILDPGWALQLADWSGCFTVVGKVTLPGFGAPGEYYKVAIELTSECTPQYSNSYTWAKAPDLSTHPSTWVSASQTGTFATLPPGGQYVAAKCELDNGLKFYPVFHLTDSTSSAFVKLYYEDTIIGGVATHESEVAVGGAGLTRSVDWAFTAVDSPMNVDVHFTEIVPTLAGWNVTMGVAANAEQMVATRVMRAERACVSPAWSSVPSDPADMAVVARPGVTPVTFSAVRAPVGQCADIAVEWWDPGTGIWATTVITVSDTDVAGCRMGNTWQGPGVSFTTKASRWGLLAAGSTDTPPGGGGFSTPAADDAPWYDPTVPESAEFQGLWIEELLMPTPYKRTMRPTQRGGSAAALQWGPREIHITGWLLATSLKGARYGREWLMEALIDGNCSPACDLPNLTMYRTCCGDPDEERRTLKRVALTEPPNWNLEPTFPSYAGLKFELTMQAEEPFFYREPVSVASGLVYDLMADAECNACSGCSEGAAGGGCLCGNLAAPERVATRDDSADDWCSPLLVRRRYVPVPPTPAWSSAAAVVKIKTGTLETALGGRGLSNLRLLAFSNPLGLTGPTWSLGDGPPPIDYRSYFICGQPCVSIEVSCLPPDSELVIDATTRTATLTCGNVSSSGYRYLSSNDGSAFRWPEFDCSGLMVVIEADDQHTPPDTTFEVLAVGRDRS